MSPMGVGLSGVRMQSPGPQGGEPQYQTKYSHDPRNTVSSAAYPINPIEAHGVQPFPQARIAPQYTDLLGGTYSRGQYASGGPVDTVHAMLAPREFVIDRDHADEIRYSSGPQLGKALAALSQDIKSGRRPGDRPTGPVPFVGGGTVTEDMQPGYALGGPVEERKKLFGVQEQPQQVEPVRATITPPPATPLTVRRPGGIQTAQPPQPRMAPPVTRLQPPRSPVPQQVAPRTTGITRPGPSLAGVTQAQPGLTADIGQIRPQPLAPLAQGDPLRTPVYGSDSPLAQLNVDFANQQAARRAEEQRRQYGVEGRNAQGWEAIAGLYGYEGEGDLLRQWAEEKGYTVLNDGTIVDPNAPPGYERERNIKDDGGFFEWKEAREREKTQAETEAGEKTAREAIDQKRQDKLQRAEEYITKAATEGAELKRRIAQFTAQQKAAVSGLAMSQAMAARGTQSMQAGLGSMANAQHQAILQGAAEQFAGEMEAERLMLSAELRKMEIELQILDEEIADEQDDKRRAQMIADQNRMAEAAAANARHQQALQAQIAEASKPSWWESLLPALITGGMGLIGNMLLPGVGGVIGGAAGSAASSAIMPGLAQDPGAMTGRTPDMLYHGLPPSPGPSPSPAPSVPSSPTYRLPPV